MCVFMVSKRIKRPAAIVVEGYKVFRKRGSKLYPIYYHPDPSVTSVDFTDSYVPIKRGEWFKATEKAGWSRYSGYPAGFHIFKEKKFAENYSIDRSQAVVVKVKARYVHTHAQECAGEEDIFIASEMMIPSRFVKKPRHKV